MDKLINNKKDAGLQKRDQDKINAMISELLYQLGIIEYKHYKLKTNNSR